MPVLDVFSRQGCHLCEVLIEELVPLVRGTFSVAVHDIDSRPDWREKYDTLIPVVEFEGRLVCQYRLDRSAIAELKARMPTPGCE